MSDFVLSRVPGSATHFQQLYIGDLRVSIQASEFHYCSPRQNLASSDQYQEFEVALFFSKGDWFHPEKDPRFCKSPWAKNWSEYDDVAPNVSRQDVADMLRDLRSQLS